MEMAVSMMRLDKLLTEMGEGTRQEVKKLIRKGQVSVNGTIVKIPDQKVNEQTATIRCQGRNVCYEPVVYYMMHKPAGVVSATEDKKEKTVLDLLERPVRTGVFPVGRLDKDTEGLLLLTNDGEFSHRLLSPKKHVDKTYEAVIDGIVGDEDVILFSRGVDIGDDTLTLPAVLKILEVDREKLRSEIAITIQEGRYHQIKRMFQAVGKGVRYLKRIRMGSLILDPQLKKGEVRRLTEEEIARLKGSSDKGD